MARVASVCAVGAAAAAHAAATGTGEAVVAVAVMGDCYFLAFVSAVHGASGW